MQATYYYYALPFHYYNTWMIGEFVMDDFGNSVSPKDLHVWGIEDNGYDD